MKKEEDFIIIHEKKCPKCGSAELGPTGIKWKVQGFDTMIGLECYICGEKTRMPESLYKP